VDSSVMITISINIVIPDLWIGPTWHDRAEFVNISRTMAASVPARSGFTGSRKQRLL